jgi:glutathione-regulated potassium-efflux system ancillary protein KefG
MNKVLILFAHPRFEKSKTNRALIAGIDQIEGVRLHDLYEEYPDFNIDVLRERQLLLEHQVFVWHFPFYMYSAPALFKQWMDMVLEYGWARGSKGNALAGKTACLVLTAGGTRQVYARNALHCHTIREFLVPFEQSVDLCKMSYLPPFVVHGTHLLTAPELARHTAFYRDLLGRLVHGQVNPESLRTYDYMNDWLAAVARDGQPDL